MWEWCLHITTTPIARVVGKVGDDILDKGLGPIGNFPPLQDSWDSVAPDFCKEGLQTFCVQDEWEDRDRVVKWASRWVSRQVERVVSAPRRGADRPPSPDLLPVGDTEVISEGFSHCELCEAKQTG